MVQKFYFIDGGFFMKDLVANKVVKMEWLKKAFVIKNKVFYGCANDYETANGKVTVFFSTNEAYLFEDEEGLWTMGDLVPRMIEFAGDVFPDKYTQYVPLTDEGCGLDTVLEKYGLSEFKADIEARVADVAPYGDEKEQ